MDIIDKFENGLVTLDDQEEALKDSAAALWFALKVPGADIEKCQEVACKQYDVAYWFAKDIPGANIKKCHEAVLKDPQYAYYFARYIPEADIKKSIVACKGTKWENRLNQYMMEKALL